MESLKPKVAVSIAWALAFFQSGAAWGAVTKISSIDFVGNQKPNRIQIHADGPLDFNKQVNEADKQIVFEIKNATLTRMASRKVDTSSFDSKVLLISPYQVEGQPDTVRVVLQMREGGDVDVDSSASGLSISVGAPQVLDATPSAGKSLDANAANTEETASVGDGDVAKISKPDKTEVNAASVLNVDQSPAQTPLEKKMDQFLSHIESKQFSGKPITLQVRDMDVADVFTLISETSGFNIVLSPDIKGKVSLSLSNVPWDQALDVVLQSQGLAGVRNHSILRILPIEKLTEERYRDNEAKTAVIATVPRLTRIFPISYANLEDLRKTITDLVTQAAPPPTRPAGGANTAALTPPIAPGMIAEDKRTNSLIIKDTAENLDKIAKLIKLLDVQTPQVLIEGKIVEATEQFSRSLSGSLGALGGPNPSFMSFNGGNPVDSLIGGVFTNGSSIASTTANAGSIGMSFMSGVKRLNAIINMGETESTLKVLSSPRAVVANKQKANITQTTPIAITSTVIANGATTVSTTMLYAELSLDVTPTVTNDGSVRMELNIKRDVPSDAGGGQLGVAGRKITTDVVVDSGTTLVLGGFYTVTDRTSGSGFPFLRKLPLLGALFGSESKSMDRSELFFFITPQIIDPKKAGFGT